jgi:GNAT superfamily N-acetyltransferase
MIRQATSEDVSAIAQVHVQSWQETYADVVYPHILAEQDVNKRLELWSQVLKLKNHIVLVAIDAGRIQGFIDVSLNEEKGIAKIMALYVLKAAQKKGLGKALFEQALQDVHPMQYPQILLNVYNQNPACQFYEYMGGQCIAIEDASEEGENLKILHYLWEREPFENLVHWA